MTDIQVNQLFEPVTKTVNGIQRLEKEQSEIKTDIVEMKGDISELKQGQARIEKQVLFKINR